MILKLVLVARLVDRLQTGHIRSRIHADCRLRNHSYALLELRFGWAPDQVCLLVHREGLLISRRHVSFGLVISVLEVPALLFNPELLGLIARGVLVIRVGLFVSALHAPRVLVGHRPVFGLDAVQTRDAGLLLVVLVEVRVDVRVQDR